LNHEDDEESLIDFNRLYDISTVDIPADSNGKLSLFHQDTNNPNDSGNIPSIDLTSADQPSQPGSSKQMTPPKSVEQPLSNQSQVAGTFNATFPSSARTPSSSNLITSNSSTILPPTYDDLNNIFEEDSADENQIQQQQPSNAVKDPAQQQQSQPHQQVSVKYFNKNN